MSGYTPMMQQYFTIKEKFRHCILLFRLGDFFEMFFEDAKTASQALGIALTARDCGQEERAPMCGVPAHAVDGYIARLVAQGFHVALCDQVEDAKFAKGIVKRDVVRVITPGTVTDAQLLEENRHNYIACVHHEKDTYAIATADITTGLFMVTAVPDSQKMTDELTRIAPAEILLPEGFPLTRVVENVTGLKATPVPAWTFTQHNAFKCLTEHFYTLHLEGFGLSHHAPEIPAAGALLSYLAETQKHALAQVTAIKPYTQQNYMVLDAPSRRNLELTTRMREPGKKGSLLGVLDHTKTAMGARLLRSWVELPLLCTEEINRRQQAVAEWHENPLRRADLQIRLQNVHDLERIMARLAARNANARDLATLRASLHDLPAVGALLRECKSAALAEISRTYDNLADIHENIAARIVEAPPHSTREGGMIRPGVNARLDELNGIRDNAADFIARYELRQREETGIHSLKVKNNRVFGYYIEVTAANLSKVPPHYNRKQTIANGERYTTAELKKWEEAISGAEEEITALEYDLFDAVRREVVEQMTRVQFTAMALATLDALQSLAEAADRGRYVRPIVDNSTEIYIKEGRHPVLESSASDNTRFIPNDTHMGDATHRLSVITGPNMSGKSTYMRQVALIVLMAHIGSFVPAEEARVGAVDRIFTRVGASDDLATGQSTFMVEMTEVANILHNATRHSLIILDEIGRGTSTYDGLSIAWAVLEHIVEGIGAKTLFATHYHELTQLESQLPGVLNFCFTTQEQGADIVFLRKLVRGEAGQSYGIHVARLAGLPKTTLERAEKLLRELNPVARGDAS
ncbi:MAG: DNA mismatch repair protein MutS [Defluviitaleaceae bacterium]|nr:DNA mismatch repair protein MutS [Defluviitaleaceae bacterium]MCL2238989.1 DNA mismatch repair protein MutS [Defluviitaleaceae bacterium]